MNSPRRPPPPTAPRVVADAAPGSGLSTQQIGVRVSYNLLEALNKRAKDERRTLAAMIRVCLQDEIERYALGLTPPRLDASA
jgi:hypothetical protein